MGARKGYNLRRRGAKGLQPLPVQSTYWRFLDSLGPHNEGQLMKINTEMSRRVWAAGKVKLKRIYLDTDSTMNTVYGDQPRAPNHPLHHLVLSHVAHLVVAAEPQKKQQHRTHHKLPVAQAVGLPPHRQPLIYQRQQPQLLPQRRQRQQPAVGCQHAAPKVVLR
jgi:hypothetical protein